MTGHKDIEGRDKFFKWLDSHRDLIETTPHGYITSIRIRYTADTKNIIADKGTVSRWLNVYRTKNDLTIKRLTQPYTRKSSRNSNYEKS